MVRQSAQRKWTPEILESAEIQNLLLQLNSCFRLMVFLDVTAGLRRSELLALKWSDVDFSTLELNVVRSIYLRMLGKCKTEASRKPVPLDLHVAADLRLWKEASAYSKPDDWIFASRLHNGRKPYWGPVILRKYIQPEAKRLGINKRIGWHTFRRGLGTRLNDLGVDGKTIQTILRHANISTTQAYYILPDKARAKAGMDKLSKVLESQYGIKGTPKSSLRSFTSKRRSSRVLRSFCGTQNTVIRKNPHK